MKICIELSDTEVKALRVYLKSVSPDIKPVINKDEIKKEINGIVQQALQLGVYADYRQ